MTEFEKLFAIVTSPTRAFDAIRLSPTWVVPLLLVLIVNIGIQFVVYNVIATDGNFDRVAREKIEWDARASGTVLTPTDLQSQINALRRQKTYWYLGPLIGIPLSLLPMAIFFYIVLRLVRAGTTFLQVFSVLCWSFVIYRAIGGLFIIAALLVHGASNFFPVPAEAWSPTSLAQFIPRSSLSPGMYSAISKLDLFLVWWLAVMVIGLSRVSRNLTIARSCVIVSATEVAYLGLNAAGLLP